MSDVPDEVLKEILSKLPVVPLLRFRCVSKSWKGLIDSQQFIEEHLNHARNTNSNLYIILRNSSLYSLDFNLLQDTNRGIFKRLSHPLYDRSISIGHSNIMKTLLGSKTTELLGSCDGLLALLNDEDDDFILWNPSVKRFHELPKTDIDFPDYFTGCSCIVYGFGYDFAGKDYKLVRIVQFYKNYDNDFGSEVKIYSFKSNSWKRIVDFPYYLKYKRFHGILANGALHWVVSRKVKSDTKCLVAAIDLATEEYRLVPLPNFAGKKVILDVGVLGGCLCLICDDFKDNVDIWVMKEYGVEESWSILFTFDLSKGNHNILTPLAYSKCGRKVVIGLDDNMIMWYNLDENSTYSPMVQMPRENFYELNTCLQTLVLFKTGICDFDLCTKKKQERVGKKSNKTMNDHMAKNGGRLFRPNPNPN